MADENPNVPPPGGVGEFLGIGNEQQSQDDSLQPLTGVNAELQNRITELLSSQNRNNPLPAQLDEFLRLQQTDQVEVGVEDLTVVNEATTGAAQLAEGLTLEAESSESGDILFKETQKVFEENSTSESGSGDGGGGDGNSAVFGNDATNFEELLEDIEVGFGESRFSDR